MEPEMTVAIGEVTDTLAAHRHLACALEVEGAGGQVRVTLVMALHSSLEMLSLCDELRWLRDLGQVRAFATRYGIEPAALEALIGHIRKED